jgi:hypothetical protein
MTTVVPARALVCGRETVAAILARKPAGTLLYDSSTRHSLEFPTFDRDELVALLEAEQDLSERTTMSAEEARERFGTEHE